MGNRRVVLGSLGTDSGTEKFGLRVSRSGADACPSASSSATVAVDELSFDSLGPIGHFPIYKIYDVTVAAATQRTDICYYSGYTPLSYAHAANSYVGTYGETLQYVPLPFCCEKDGSTIYSDRYQQFKWGDWHACYHFSTSVDYGGWAVVSKTGFTVYNLNLSQTVFRLFLLDWWSVT